MRLNTRSFASRLAALEAIEQAAPAGDELPSVATMSDASVAAQATYAIRDGAIRVELSAPSGPVRLMSVWTNARVAKFYTDLAARAERIFSDLPPPLLFLADWEIEHAIQAIDDGRCIVSWSEHMRGNALVRHCYFLSPAFDAHDDVELKETLRAVGTAHNLVIRQLHYPQPRDFTRPEMTTLGEWRDWLMEVLDVT